MHVNVCTACEHREETVDRSTAAKINLERTLNFKTELRGGEMEDGRDSDSHDREEVEEETNDDKEEERKGS